MNDNKDESMKRALQARRGKGLDISIMVGQPNVDENKATDLAPKPEGMMAGAEKEGMGGDMLSDMKASDMLGQLQDHEKQEIMDRDPRSLMERAKKEALMKAPQPNPGMMTK